MSKEFSGKKSRISSSKAIDESTITECSGDENDDVISLETGSIADDSSRSETPTQQRKSKKRGRGKATCKLRFKCSNNIKEDHGQPIFGCQFNHHCKPGQPLLFATVGSNRVTVYQALPDGKIKLLQAYADPDTEESFYTCAWTYEPNSGHPLLVAAGHRGIIRVFSIILGDCIKHFIGHGQSVNELKFHPKDPTLLLSVGKDHSLRLWNMESDVCICVLGGVDGHRDEVLSGDFNLGGSQIVSCGMDHSLKIWCLDKPRIQEAIEKSRHYDAEKKKRVFDTVAHHYPDFTTRDIHRNYVDCCRWFGKFILSKSCENQIISWKPGKITEFSYELKLNDSRTSVLHSFDFRDCEIWFMRFSMDFYQKMLAQGNQLGKVYVWDLDVEDLSQSKCTILSHPKCNAAIRQTHFSRDGSSLICVCDDATVWRWDKIN